MSDTLITVADAGKMLGCSRTTVRWLIDKGDLTPLVPPHEGARPRRLFLRLSEVERLQAADWRIYKKRGS